MLGFFLPVVCLAEVTGLTTNPSTPVMGQMVVYSLVDDGMDDISTVKWEYKYGGSCAAGYPYIEDTTQTGTQAIYYENRPGPWNLRVTITYNPNSGGGPPHAPTILTPSVTIAPATGFTIAAGLNTPANWGDPIFVEFQVKAGSVDCGPYLGSVLAQEKITNKWFQSPPLNPPPWPDSNWTPNQADPKFQLDGSVVKDKKDLEDWSQALFDAVSGVFYEADQEIRLKYEDPCGVTQYISLGTVRLKRVKVSATEWKVVTQ